MLTVATLGIFQRKTKIARIINCQNEIVRVDGNCLYQHGRVRMSLCQWRRDSHNYASSDQDDLQQSFAGLSVEYPYPLFQSVGQTASLLKDSDVDPLPLQMFLI